MERLPAFFCGLLPYGVLTGLGLYAFLIVAENHI